MTLLELFEQGAQGTMPTIGFEIFIDGTPIFSGALNYEEVNPMLRKYSGLSNFNPPHDQVLFQVSDQIEFPPRRATNNFRASISAAGETPGEGWVAVDTSNNSTSGVSFTNPEGNIKVLLFN